ncbi:hypothetical protein NDA18_005834 [Ustilago nuda]|nr:hypothetical protein NDA18_005834 [Ustilago nuda]
MSLAKSVYNTVFKLLLTTLTYLTYHSLNPPTFHIYLHSISVGSIFFGAFAFGIGYDLATTAWWDSHNKGKQWKDIRGKYLEDSK